MFCNSETEKLLFVQDMSSILAFSRRCLKLINGGRVQYPSGCAIEWRLQNIFVGRENDDKKIQVFSASTILVRRPATFSGCTEPRYQEQELHAFNRNESADPALKGEQMNEHGLYFRLENAKLRFDFDSL